MLAPHDLAQRAVKQYVWRDEEHFLLADPPITALISETTTRYSPTYHTFDQAEQAFWDAIVGAILPAVVPDDPHASWPGFQLAVVRDPISGKLHVAERRKKSARAWEVGDAEEAQLLFLGRLRLRLDDE